MISPAISSPVTSRGAVVGDLSSATSSSDYRNLGNNPLNNQLSDMFGKLSKLKEMLYIK